MKTPRLSDVWRSFRVPKKALTADPGFWESASLQRAARAAHHPPAPRQEAMMNPRRRTNHARAIALAVILAIALVLSGQQAPLANQAGPVRFIAPPAGFIGERLTLVGVGLGR